VGGFIDVFEEELRKIDFPIPINKVRLAAEPLNATAKGLLLAALNDEEMGLEEPVKKPAK